MPTGDDAMPRWLVSRSCFETISRCLYSTSPAYHQMDEVLAENRQNFVNLLQTECRSAVDNRTLTEAAKAGSSVKLKSGLNVRPSEAMVSEALILSQLFNINELDAYELVLEGDAETTNYAGLARGLCAVLVFYNSRYYWAQSLRSLVRALPGRRWASNTQPDIARSIQRFLNGLVKEGVMSKILDLLSSFDLSAELDKLQQPHVNGLGSAKHRKLVTDLISNTYNAMAETLLFWSAQVGLTERDLTMLFTVLRKNDLQLGFRFTDCALLMTVLNELDTSFLQAVESEKVADLEAWPLTREGSRVALCSRHVCEMEWADLSMQAVARLAWAVAMRSLLQHHLTQTAVEFISEDEEEVVERALADRPFHWLRQRVLRLADFHSSELFLRAAHSLLTNLIVAFPVKIRELRTRGDEEMRIAEDAAERGATVSRPALHFQQLLLTLSDLYSDNRLKLNLSMDYWLAAETDLGGSLIEAKFTQRQLGLHTFVRSCVETSLAAAAQMAGLQMVAEMAANAESARHAFNLFLSTHGTPRADYRSAAITWDHFFNALRQYLCTLRVDSAAAHRPSSTRRPPQIAPEELKGLLTFVQLATNIANEDEFCRAAFIEQTNWACLDTCVGLSGCPIPLELKRALFELLGALARSRLACQAVWDRLVAADILHFLDDGKLAGLNRELEEVECRAEEYPATAGLLALLAALCAQPAALPSAAAFAPYLHFVVASVACQFLNRSYKHKAQMWHIGALSFEILRKLIGGASTTLSDDSAQQETPGAVLMTQLSADGPLFRAVVSVIDDGLTYFDQYPEFEGRDELARVTLAALQLVETVLEKDSASGSGGGNGIGLLLQTLNTRTMQHDHLLNIASYVTQAEGGLRAHGLAAVRCVRLLGASAASVQRRLVLQLTRDAAAADRLRLGFVDALALPPSHAHEDDATEVGMRTAENILEMLHESLRIGAYAPNMAFFLLGFDLKRPQTTKLENPGVNGTALSCLHCTVYLLRRLRDGERRLARVAEAAARVLLELASHERTAAPTLRYLRGAHDLCVDLLSNGLSDAPAGGEGEEATTRRRLDGAILQLAATELIHLLASGQTSQALRIVNLVSLSSDDPDFGKAEQSYATDAEESNLLGGSIVDASKSAITASPQVSKSAGISALAASRRGGTSEPLLLEVLTRLDLSAQTWHLADLHFFDAKRLAQVVSACTRQSGDGAAVCDVAALHSLLMREVAALDNSALGPQRPAVVSEVERVLEEAVAFNGAQRAAGASAALLAGWSRLVEVVHSVGVEAQPLARRLQLSADIVAALVKKTLSCDVAAETSAAVASCLLLVTGSVRRVCAADAAEPSALDLTRTPAAANARNKAAADAPHLHSLLPLFQHVIEFVLRPGSHAADARLLGYGALLNCLYVGSERSSPLAATVCDDSSALLDGLSVRQRLRDDQWTVLQRYAPELLRLCMRDAAHAPEVVKTMALSCTAALLHEDACRGARLAALLVRSGFVGQLVDGLRADDAALRAALLAQTADLRPLFLYQIKLAVLMRLAVSDEGAAAQLEAGSVRAVAAAAFWADAPADAFVAAAAPSSTDDRAVSPLARRYLLLWEAALTLCLALCANRRALNTDLKRQVVGFIISNGDLLAQFIRQQKHLAETERRILTIAGSLVRQCFEEDPTNLTETDSRIAKLMTDLKQWARHPEKEEAIGDGAPLTILRNLNDTTSVFKLDPKVEDLTQSKLVYG